MKLLVVGATGATGRLVMADAVRRGHSVRALVRDDSARDDSARRETAGGETARDVGVTEIEGDLVRGDVRDGDAVAAALAGVDAVVSCLGVRLGQPPGTVRSTGTAVLVAQMRRAGLRRLVAVSTVGVGSSVARQSRPARLLWPRIVGRERLREADLAERAIQVSDLDWVIVRPPRLVDVDTPSSVDVGPSVRTGFSSQLARVDLARLLVDLVETDRFIREAVTAVGKR